MKKNLINLAKSHDFETCEEYRQYIIDSWYNGQKSQCLSLFESMQKNDQVDFIELLAEFGRFTISLKDKIEILAYLLRRTILN